jgi:NADH pyrophosphatase NudC (nudix superfamily)
VWLTADSVYENDASAVGENTQLGVFVTKLEALGLGGRAKTVDELLEEMRGKLFVWERAKLTTSSKEKWVPKKLVEEVQKCTKCGAEVKDYMRFCPNCGAKLRR